MHVTTSTKTYKNRKYTYVRIVETTRENGKRKNKVVKILGKGETNGEVNALKKEATLYLISEYNQNVKIDLSKLDKIEANPGGIKLLSQFIVKNYGLETILKEKLGEYYDCFYEELSHRFYFLKSELGLSNKTGISKDRFYHFLDRLCLIKDDLEKSIYNALVQKKKIVNFEVKIDSTSTYFESSKMSIAMYGYSRDKRSDRKQVIIMLVLVDNYPVFSFIYQGNKKDNQLLIDVISKLKEKGLNDITFFSDRGFFHEDHFSVLDTLKVNYIVATPRRVGAWNSYFKLEKGEHVIDNKRAVMYVNEKLRETLLNELNESVLKLSENIHILSATELKKKFPHMKKYIDFKTKKIKQKMLDKERNVLGKCLLITSIPLKRKSTDVIISDYKSLTDIEANFRILKTDLLIRPIYHQNETRVRAHIFMCVLTLLFQTIIIKDFGKEVFRNSLEDKSFNFIGKDFSCAWQQNKKFYDSLP